MKYLNVNKIVNKILEQNVTSKDFSKWISENWKISNFILVYENIKFLYTVLLELSFEKLVTEHGRVGEQPLSVSQHLFGDKESVAARLVYDPPNFNNDLYIEYHTHPVDTLIIVLNGSGTYSLVYDDSDIHVDVPLEPGVALLFPSGTVHTIKEVSKDGLETLNITDRLNQPEYRNKVHDSKTQFLVKPSDDFSKRSK